MTEGLILDYFLEFLAQIICDITIRVDHPTNKRKGNFAPPLVPKCPNDMQIGGQFNFPTLKDTSFAPCLSIPRISANLWHLPSHLCPSNYINNLMNRTNSETYVTNYCN